MSAGESDDEPNIFETAYHQVEAERIKRELAGRAKRLANLKRPWQPGQSGNPEGYNKKARKLAADMVALEEAEDVQAVIAMLWGRAVRGDAHAGRVYLDKVVGETKQTIDLTNAPDEVLRWFAEHGPK